MYCNGNKGQGVNCCSSCREHALFPALQVPQAHRGLPAAGDLRALLEFPAPPGLRALTDSPALPGLPANAVDIALLAGTMSGAPYDPLSALEASNSSASISDQR